MAESFKRGRKVAAKLAEAALDPAGAADQHMVGAGQPLGRHEFAGEGSKAALHAIADDRIADLLGDGETNAHHRVAIFAVTDQQDEAWSSGALAFIGGKEIRALADND